MEHQLEHKLNEFLNEMVCVRPTQPMNWLARRLRKEEAGGLSPAANTVPLLDAAAGSAAVFGVENGWWYRMSYAGEAATPPSAGAAGVPAAPVKTGLELAIEPLGEGVLLSIRPS